MRRTAALLVALLAGCGSSSVPSSAPPSTPSAVVLPAGKSDLPLSGSYLSPDGFVPPLALTVPSGWSSTHRGDDAFDLSKPDPAHDAPSVVVALITPLGDTVATTLAALKKAAKGAVTAATGTLAGQPATGFEEVGGSGELVASPSGTLALDAFPAGHLRVLGVDIDQVPLLAVVVVPDGRQWPAQQAAAEELLAGITSA
jgi:hypothetical protein